MNEEVDQSVQGGNEEDTEEDTPDVVSYSHLHPAVQWGIILGFFPFGCVVGFICVQILSLAFPSGLPTGIIVFGIGILFSGLGWLKTTESGEELMKKSVETHQQQQESFSKSNSVSREEAQQYIAEDAGSTVTPERIGSIESMLNPDEEVYHMIDPGVVKHGDDNTSATTPGKDSMVAFTNKRIIIRVGHWTTDDQFTIRYDRIQSVQFDSPGASGMLGVKYFIINTANNEYKIQVGEEVDEAPEIVNWTDKKSAEAVTPDSGRRTSNSAEDGTEKKSVAERLEELEKLHKKGIVDDDEYNDKREELLNEL